MLRISRFMSNHRSPAAHRSYSSSRTTPKIRFHSCDLLLGVGLSSVVWPYVQVKWGFRNEAIQYDQLSQTPRRSWAFMLLRLFSGIDGDGNRTEPSLWWRESYGDNPSSQPASQVEGIDCRNDTTSLPITIEEKGERSQNHKHWTRYDRILDHICSASEVPRSNIQLVLLDTQSPVDHDYLPSLMCIHGNRQLTINTSIYDIMSDDAVAAGIAHEIIHHKKDHFGLNNFYMLPLHVLGLFANIMPTSFSQSMVYANLYRSARNDLWRDQRRKLEVEADLLSLPIMAKAGYDPRAAIAFWELIDLATGDQDVHGNDWIHLTYKKRIALLQEQDLEGLTEIYQNHPRGLCMSNLENSMIRFIFTAQAIVPTRWSFNYFDKYDCLKYGSESDFKVIRVLREIRKASREYQKAVGIL